MKRAEDFEQDTGYPRIDIVIVAKNESRFIGECLEALQAQDYPESQFNIFVVDNGSTDATVEIAEKHGATLLQQRQGNLSDLRNSGIRQGNAPLVAFLDAHCVPEKNWLRTMAGSFTSPNIGGCQSVLKYKSLDPDIEAYLQKSGLFSNAYFQRNSISGLVNPYPWVTTANSMFRRFALEEAGLFDSRFQYCEDVDLSWRVILAGYQLVYVGDTGVSHYNEKSWYPFFKQIAGYGKGIADIGYKYNFKYRSPGLPMFSREGLAYWLFYQKGYWQKLMVNCLGLGTRPERFTFPRNIENSDLRPWFAWNNIEKIKISARILYWLAEAETFVVLDMQSKKHFKLQDAAFRIWNCLIKECSEGETITQLARHYQIPAEDAGADVREFIGHLMTEQLVTTQGLD